MKLTTYACVAMLAIFLMSCSSDDNTEDLTGETGTLTLKFDNSVGDSDFIFGDTYTKSNNESYKLTTLKYLISNVSITDSEGNTFTYPYDENIFIIDEANADNEGAIHIILEGVEAADYTQVTFGIGVDQERYNLGAEGQGDFLEEAADAGMLWNWSTGYRFTRFDGTYSSDSVTDEALAIHMGSVGNAIDNYREVTLDFPNSVRVREDASPQIHIVADIAKVFDGTTSVNFSDGYDQVHTSAETTPVIADNMQGIFTVHHVHN